MKTLHIKVLNKKTINTKFGDKEKYSIVFEERPGEWFDSFVGNWNKTWAVGMEVQIDDDQWQSREYNGKTYWTIKAPDKNKALEEQVNMLAERVAKLESKMEEVLPTTN